MMSRSAAWCRSSTTVKGVRLVLLSIVAVACYSGPPASHFVGVLDELVVPAAWQVAETVVRGPDQPDSCDPAFTTTCPAAARFFVFDDAGIDRAYGDAMHAVTSAGFSSTDEGLNGCPAGTSGGRPCGFFAARATDRIHVGVFQSPKDAGLEKRGIGFGAVSVLATSTEG